MVWDNQQGQGANNKRVETTAIRSTDKIPVFGALNSLYAVNLNGNFTFFLSRHLFYYTCSQYMRVSQIPFFGMFDVS